jgi:hypothetical protein
MESLQIKDDKSIHDYLDRTDKAMMARKYKITAARNPW